MNVGMKLVVRESRDEVQGGVSGSYGCESGLKFSGLEVPG